ncbi:MAG: serine hydrolase [Clostridia bacterium]|nr:serine hydrolase [Clostridia bacterium]
MTYSLKRYAGLLLAIFLLCSSFAGVLAEGYVYTEPAKIVKLARSTPEEKGISSQYLYEMLNQFDLQGIEMHGIAIAVGGEVIFDAYWAPYDEDTPHIVHSLTKLFTNAAAVVAISEGYLTLDTRMIDILPEFVSEDGPLENQDKVTVRNLLTMTAGYGRMISGSEWRPLQTSWLEAFFAEPIPYEPGTHYQYSSGNPYAVSAMVQRTTGMTAEDYLMKSGFSALNLRNFTWQKSPEGICSGGNGVTCTVEDMLKVGILFANEGEWNGTQILDSELVKLAIGYGGKLTEGQDTYAFHWTDREDGNYTAGGSYGQTVILVPELDMVISATAGTSGDNYSVFNDYLIAPTKADREQGITSYESEDEYSAALERKVKTLSLLDNPVLTASYVGELVDGKVFEADENKYNIESVSLDVTDDAIVFNMTDNRGTHMIVNGIDRWAEGETTMTGNYMHHQYQNELEPYCAYAEWKDDTTLSLTWRYPQMAFVDGIELTFTQDGSEMTLVRTVNVNSGELITEPVLLH